MSKSGSASATTGYRYYFSILMGLCRGPVDRIIQIQCGGRIAWDGSPQQVAPEAETGYVDQEGDPSSNYVGGGTWNGGPIEATAEIVPIQRPDLFGGDKSQGGVEGSFDVYMGDAQQTLGDRITAIMQTTNGLVMSALRGAVTVFFDGEICANNPNPQQFTIRLGRAIKGWYNDNPWYPATAVIPMSDPSIATYNENLAVGNGDTITNTASDGHRTTVVTSLYGQQTVTTYDPDGGITTSTAVPQSYNEIYAMNPAHIIYECCTNPDWGRGLDPSLIDQASFTGAANQLYNETFGMCLKWSRTDDIDTFIQHIIDTIGAVLFTNKFTGLMCLRLIRADYQASDLFAFDTDHGLISVETSNSAAQDAVPNEIIVQYNSPVLNSDQQARAQNIASINALGAVYSETKSYTGIPTSDLAVKAAQRDLKALSSGYRSLVVTLDRRAYLIVPGDVIIVNKPDQNLNGFIMRVAQVEETEVTSGVIKVTGTQDVYSISDTLFAFPQPSTFLEPNLYPSIIVNQVAIERSYRDLIIDGTIPAVTTRVVAPTPPDPQANQSYVRLVAQQPTPSSVSFGLYSSTDNADYTGVSEYQSFMRFAKISQAAKTNDYVIYMTGEINPRTTRSDDCLLICTPDGSQTEYVKVVSVSVTKGVTAIGCLRGCVDTYGRAWPVGSYVFIYQTDGIGDTGDPTIYGLNELVHLVGLPSASLGDLQLAEGHYTTVVGRARQSLAYCGGNFRVGAFPRDQMPTTPLGPEPIPCSWTHRNRLAIQDKLLDEQLPFAAPEGGTIYTLYVSTPSGAFFAIGDPDIPGGWLAAAALNYGAGGSTANATTLDDAGNVIVTDQVTIYGTTCGIRSDQCRAVGFVEPGDVTVTLNTANHNGNSLFTPSVTFLMDPRYGWGNCFGHIWGGVYPA